MTRLPDWDQRLGAYIDRMARTAFRPGRADCALFTAGAVAAMTGIDPARGWRGYRTLAEGRRDLAARGFDSAVALAASLLAERSAVSARPGDVAVVETPAGPALGIVAGPEIYVIGPGGLNLVPRAAMIRAFAV